MRLEQAQSKAAELTSSLPGIEETLADAVAKIDQANAAIAEHNKSKAEHSSQASQTHPAAWYRAGQIGRAPQAAGGTRQGASEHPKQAELD